MAALGIVGLPSKKGVEIDGQADPAEAILTPFGWKR